MAHERLDTTPLSRRATWSRWRRFRAEAIAGRHGADLAEPRWWKRSQFALLTTLLVVGAPVLPVAVLATEGRTVLGVSMAALWAASMVAVVVITWWTRHDSWGPRARTRLRLTEFALANGLRYQPEAGGPRQQAHIFGSATRRSHLDRFEAPEPRGFVVANYQETYDDGASESDTFEAGYVVFTLRESYPHTLVTTRAQGRPRNLRDVDPVDGPAGTRVWSTKPGYPLLQRLLLDTGVVEHALGFGRSAEVEIVGNELFLLTGGFLRLRSPRVWQRLDATAEALAPFLALPAGGSGPSGPIVLAER
ncbi:hypothetical protein [Jiangella muralis]|uniref:hypothetical protein n=1 Tax=Jiangella muralis TaxID=702383 RepID=UPI00069F62B3|nr:hypothetical protein [Jiangella muralis]